MQALRNYRWSSYREYAGLADPIGFLETGPLLCLAGLFSTGAASKAYARYVEGGLVTTDEEFRDVLRSARWGIGDEQFQDRVARLYQSLRNQAPCPEDVSFRKIQSPKSEQEILGMVAASFNLTLEQLCQRRRGCRARAVAARLLWRHAGLNQREIGRALGMGTGAAVSQHLKGLEEALLKDQELSRRAQALEQQLRP
jgi:hypothetical protein